MATYRTTKCPNCGYEIEDRVPTARELIGHPVEACPRCKNLYRTGKKYWKDMSTKERLFYILREVFIGFYTALFFSMIPVLVLALILRNSRSMWLAVTVFPVSFAVIVILVVLKNIRLAKLTENDVHRE